MSTPSQRRGQGRPGRNTLEVGRDKLVEKARAALRSRPRVDIQRREIADVAGVTPALVSYYFPDKWELLEAAARPIIEDYVETVRNLLRSGGDSSDKLKGLVRLYIVFNREHGHILDYYLEVIEKRNDAAGLAMLTAIHKEIIEFLRLNVDERHLCGMNPEVFQSLIWSTCRHIAQLPSDRQEVLFPSEFEDAVVGQQSEIIYSLLLNNMLVEARVEAQVSGRKREHAP